MRIINKILLTGVAFTPFAISAEKVTLNEAINKALNFHPQVIKGVKGRYVAEAELREAEGGYYPSLDVNLGLGKENTDSEKLPEDGTLTRKESAVTLRQMLYDGFRVDNSVGKQEALLSRANYSLSDNRQALALRVIESYLEVLRTEEQVAVTKENVKAHEEILKMVGGREQRNLSSKADEIQVQGRLSLAKAQSRREIAIQEGVIARYYEAVGEKPGELAKPNDHSMSLPKDLLNARIITHNQHPSINVNRKTIQATSYTIEEAKSAYYPKIDLELSANHGDNLSGTEGEEDFYAAMLVLNMNLFRGGSDTARVRSQVMLKEQQRQELLELERALIRDLSVSWHAREGNLIELEYFIEHMLSLESTLNAYTKQYELGKRTLFDLLNARAEYFRSKSSVVDKKYANMLSTYQIMANMGVLLDKVYTPEQVLTKK
jgi:outer membrane protein, adhesin transport system